MARFFDQGQPGRRPQGCPVDETRPDPGGNIGREGGGGATLAGRPTAIEAGTTAGRARPGRGRRHPDCRWKGAPPAGGDGERRCSLPLSATRRVATTLSVVRTPVQGAYRIRKAPI